MVKLTLIRKYTLIWLVIALITGIFPENRLNWFVEFPMMFAFLAVLVLTEKKFKFSNLSYTLMFIFLFFPLIGAYFAWENVPLSFINNFFGEQRNNYDRLVHFLFGLLMFIPVRELFVRMSKMRKTLSYVFPFFLILGFGAFYEIGEYLTISYLPEENARLFLGTQGDIFDPYKDLLVKGIGAIITLMYSVFNKNNYDTIKSER
jgi:putative membrane protein